MNDQLRDVLEQASGLARPASFDPDALWKQGVSRRRRQRGLIVTSILVMVALACGGLWLGHPGPPAGSVELPAGRPSTPAMPSQVYAVPSNVHAEDGGLDVGVIAVATNTQAGLPVVVSAIDGSYHVLNLPGYDELPYAAPSLAVSPDGKMLAYGWHGPLPEHSGRHVPSGIRVLHTMTGRISTYPVPGGVGAECADISWSVNGRWLAYTCVIDSNFDKHGSGGTVHGQRLDLATGTREDIPFVVGDGSSHMAVANDGAIAVAGGGEVECWRPNAVGDQRRTVASLTGAPDSAAWLRAPASFAVAGDVHETVRVVDARTGQRVGAPFPLAGSAELVGTVRPNQAALLIENGGSQELAIYRPGGDPVVRARIDRVTPNDAYTFATDLLRRPSRETGKPNWPTDWGALAWRFGWVLLALVALAVVVLIIRSRFRYRRRGLA